MLLLPPELLIAKSPVLIEKGFAVSKQEWGDAVITFRTRAPIGAEQVQLWVGLRCRDRDSRYVFALRGGNSNDVYLARYAPNGEAKFLGFAPLDFKPTPGNWYSLRIAILRNRFQIYLDDEKFPRINVVDSDALWSKGSIFLGGGWLPVEYADLQVKPFASKQKATFLATGDKCWTAPVVDKEAIRQFQRSEYVPAKIAAFNAERTEISLDGNWLFMPDYQLTAGQTPVLTEYDDRLWHVMKVPEFWTPGLSWLYGERGFTDLQGVSVTKGVADSLYVQETRRVESYTFDWDKTKSAWYRHSFDLPSDLHEQRFELTFDAIAKVSEVWVNGTKVGAHTGMFGEVKCDATEVIRPGRNVIAVHAISEVNLEKKPGNAIEEIAVTVEVTAEMLHSLPHGMLQKDVGGIWQPVKLTVMAPIMVKDCFIESELNGADINLDILNSGKQTAKVSLDYAISAMRDGEILYNSETTQPIEVVAGEIRHLKLTTPYLTPKLWTPQEPNLYTLEIRLKDGERVIDRYTTRFGFRTFVTEGSRFLLNGKPYWLRGANPFPHPLRPNDAELARRFIEVARDGNVRVTRSHIVPFTSTWLDAADEIGMAVSFEGIWPWLMLRGEPPDESLLKVWKDEFISLIRKYRNHPSIILWTVNNEMKFYFSDADNPTLLKKKWLILDDMVKAIRRIDPTRPVIADSAYVRKKANKNYKTVVKPNGIDDGDADDAHCYYGWYSKSFFHLYDGEYGKEFSTPGRPLISQEMSTGYPNNDDGHPVRFYLFKHHTPQALVGDDAYESADPAIFLKRQAFMTKELAETLRRTNRNTAAGVLHFAYCTWLKTPWSADGLKPLPAYHAIKMALQPVLISAELYGRHFYAGSTIHRRVCIINDSENCRAISNSHLIWEFKYDGQVLAQGRIGIPTVNYYENLWLDLDFTTPQNLPMPRVDGQLVLRLETAEKTLSENSYDVTLATSDWAKGELNEKSNICLWDPSQHSSEILSGMPVTIVNSIEKANPKNVLIIGNLEGVSLTDSEMNQLREYLSHGGHVLMLHPGDWLVKIFPDQVKAFTAKEGEIVTMHMPESAVFSGIDPLDIAWFERGDRQLPIACTGVYQTAALHKGITILACQCDVHGYLNKTSDVAKISGTPLLEIQWGKGRLLASELCFESGESDPIARRLLYNAILFHKG